MSNGYNGRDLIIKLDGSPPVAIAAVTSKEIARAREAVDVTTDDSNGWRTLLPNPGMRTIDITVEGVATAENYAQHLEMWDGSTMENIILEHPDGSTDSGAFFISALSHSGEHNGAVTFSMQMQSSGAIVTTPATS